MVRTAGALWMSDYTISDVFRIRDYISVFAAELIAILQTLTQVDKYDHEINILLTGS